MDVICLGSRSLSFFKITRYSFNSYFPTFSLVSFQPFLVYSLQLSLKEEQSSFVQSSRELVRSANFQALPQIYCGVGYSYQCSHKPSRYSDACWCWRTTVLDYPTQAMVSSISIHPALLLNYPFSPDFVAFWDLVFLIQARTVILLENIFVIFFIFCLCPL